MEQLNEERRALALEVMNLVHHFAAKHRRPAGLEYEDFVGHLMLAVVKAAASFEPELGNWAGYAYRAMRLERSTLFNRGNAAKRKLGAAITRDWTTGTGSDRDIGLLESIPDKGACPVESAVAAEQATIVNRALKQLRRENPAAIAILQASLKGSEGPALARRRGVSDRTARRRLSQAIDRLREITIKIGGK